MDIVIRFQVSELKELLLFGGKSAASLKGLLRDGLIGAAQEMIESNPDRYNLKIEDLNNQVKKLKIQENCTYHLLYGEENEDGKYGEYAEDEEKLELEKLKLSKK